MKLPAGERIETSVYKVGRVRADAPDVDRVALDPPETKTRQRGQRKKGINSAKRISWNIKEWLQDASAKRMRERERESRGIK